MTIFKNSIKKIIKKLNDGHENLPMNIELRYSPIAGLYLDSGMNELCDNHIVVTSEADVWNVLGALGVKVDADGTYGLDSEIIESEFEADLRYTLECWGLI